jgi:hypothetical protein
MNPKRRAKIPRLSASKFEEQKIAHLQHETVQPFSNGRKRNVLMDALQKHRTVIEFLLSEGRPGDEIAKPLHSVYGQDA